MDIVRQVLRQPSAISRLGMPGSSSRMPSRTASGVRVPCEHAWQIPAVALVTATGAQPMGTYIHSTVSRQSTR